MCALRIFRSLTAMFLVCLLAAPGLSNGQENEELEYTFALLGSPDGAFWVYSSEENSFYFNVISDSIYATGVETYFLIEDKIFQSKVTRAKEGMPDKVPGKEKSEEILLDFMNHEIRVLKKEQNLDIPGVQYKFKELGRYHFMEWWYDIKGSKNEVTSRTNLSVVCFDAILSIDVTLKKGQDIENERQFLEVVGKSLVKVLGPVDFDEMADRIQNK